MEGVVFVAFTLAAIASAAVLARFLRRRLAPSWRLSIAVYAGAALAFSIVAVAYAILAESHLSALAGIIAGSALIYAGFICIFMPLAWSILIAVDHPK